MRAFALVLLTALVMALPAGVAGEAALERLPTDPALVMGTLDNGLRYIIRNHKNPEGRVSIWLHVATGSLNETEATRGIAHYLEHLAFNGSTNFPPGSVVPFFQSLGLAFGRDQNAFTSFDQTTYQLALPDTRPETMQKAFLFMSDVALHLSLLPAEVDSERQIIREEKRARSGARQRVQDYVWERLAPESTLGRRLPIGIDATIAAITPAAVKDYYARWYVPANMTVIVVGDVDPAVVAATVRQQFSGGPAAAAPPRREVGVTATSATRAIVATDPELTRAEVSIVRVEPPLPPSTTVTDARRDLVDFIGTWAFNRRVSGDIAQGTVSFVDASVSVRQWARAVRMITAEASGTPEKWRTMLGDLGTALQRARLHGFSDREVEDARLAIIAGAEEALQREATLPARAVLRQINDAVARQEPPMSAAQTLALYKRVLPGISAAEVSQAFAATFDPTHVVFIAELPSGAGVPGETDLIAAGRAALDVKPERVADVARATALLDTLPPEGVVVDSREHAASGVASATLDNGVRVHHRFMDQRKNEVSVIVTLAGGQIQETAPTRGLTEAAVRAWDRPATHRLSSTQIRDLMTGTKIQVRGESGDDSVSLTVSGDPAALETGLQLAYLLLTDPVIEPAALDQWKTREIQRIAAARLQPRGVLNDAIAEAFYPAGEARLRPLTTEQVRAVTLPATQGWLDRLITEAPIEVAVVGDVERATAMRLVARYLGALRARDQISDKTLRALRAVPRPAGPITVSRVVDVQTPQAVVLEGFFGTDVQNVADVRRLAVAARVLSTRMLRTIREERQLVYSIGASSRPAQEYPGFGLFVAQAPTDPAKADALTAAVAAMYADFAKDGPSAEEMEVARKQIVSALDELLKNPDFWLARLATLDYRGLSIDDVLQARARYEAMTAEEVREAFARYDEPGSRFRFAVIPRAQRP